MAAAWWAVLCVVCVCVVVAQQPACPLAKNNQGFTSNPVTAESNTCEINGKTCCGPTWFQDVANAADPFSSSLIKLGGASNECLRRAKKLSCGVCTPNQASIVDSRSYTGYVRLCSSYCSSLLQACSSSVFGDRPVGDKYANRPGAFCRDLFSDLKGNLTLSPLIDETNCFSDSIRECTADDVTGHYTECDLTTNTRSYYYSFKPDAQCTGGVSLPSAVVGLPCYQTCEPGSFLPAAQTQCQQCSAGTYSLGGGYFFDLWKDWPSVFEWETYCESTNGLSVENGLKLPTEECKGWVLNDTFVESTAQLANSRNAVLRVKVNLVRDGTVSFTFKVDGEPTYDGFKFYVDTESLMTFYSNSGDFVYRTFPLKAGVHVLRWVYFKDASGSEGTDQAQIKNIEITGTKYADSACSSCNPGTYSEVGADRCHECPPNTYSDEYGAPSCKDCSASTYAYAGSHSCEDRRPCTADDYSSLYTPCVNGVRNRLYLFNQPVICNTKNFRLPANESNLPCASCNPGQYRPQGSSTCVTCPPGQYSGTGAASCNPCPAGSFAKKRLFYTQFDSYADLPDVTSWCQGECATNGWRLLSNDIDSGVGHGSVVNVILQIVVELEDNGSALFNYSVVCKDMCRFSFIDVNVTGGSTVFYAFDGADSGPYPFRMNLTPGRHTIQVVFSKYVDDVLTHRDNRLILHDFQISGVSTGGASSCAPCPAGYYSTLSSSVCLPCPVGTYSAGGDAVCRACPEGTFSNLTGTSQCTPCGPNTKSKADRTDCDYMNCQYSPRAGLTFDLMPLRATGGDMYGPIWDIKNHAFFLNPCQREHENRSCYDEHGRAILSHACQALPVGYSMDLGSIMGFLPFTNKQFAEDPNDTTPSGVIMTFSNGSPGCPQGSNPAFPRSTNITFICDPSAGIGYPVAVEPVEFSPCKYQFMWKSLYACPLCTRDHYRAVYGMCDHGTVTKAYVPKNFPNRCHDGVPLPPPESTPCTSVARNCTQGTYFPLDSPTSGSCINASVGKFSIGGGVFVDRFDNWNLMPSVFSRESSFELRGELIRSGPGDTELVANVFLVQSGYVLFEYKVVASGLTNGGFFFGVDDAVSLNGVTNTGFSYLSSVLLLKPGDHILRWRFVGGVTPSKHVRGNYVAINKIVIFGTEYAARQDTPCREGFYQDKEAQSSCKICPENTKSSSGQSSCTKCPEKSYSLRGSGTCELQTTCQIYDYDVNYGKCINGKMRKTYQALQPKVCYNEGPYLFSDNSTDTDCYPCPEGFLLKDGYCEKCPDGQYVKNGACVSVPEGFRAVYNITYFSSALDLPPGKFEQGELPPAFSTHCTGRCGTDGWRINNRAIESGFHSVNAEVDSILLMNVNLIHPGSLSFSYELNALKSTDVAVDEDLAGIQFYLDGELQDRTIQYHPEEDSVFKAAFPNLKAGPHKFMWVFHQPLGTNRHKRLILSDIVVEGSDVGGSSKIVNCESGSFSSTGSPKLCELCPPGTMSNVGSSTCMGCPEGYFADNWGTAKCEPCGSKISSTADRTSCDTSGCVFKTYNDVAFNLSALNYLAEVIPNSTEGTGVYKISICDKLTRDAQCFDKYNNLINNTHVCNVDTTNGIGKSSGSILNVKYKFVQFDEMEENEVGAHEQIEISQLTLSYTEGSACGFGGNSRQRTDITFVCDPSQTGTSVPTLVSSQACAIAFEWKHLAGCRVCRDDDYELRNGECIKNEQDVFTVRKSKCNGPMILTKGSQQCSPTLPVSLPAAFLLFGVFVFLLFAMLLFVINNKRMSDRYEMLVNSARVTTPPEDETEE